VELGINRGGRIRGRNSIPVFDEIWRVAFNEARGKRNDSSVPVGSTTSRFLGVEVKYWFDGDVNPILARINMTEEDGFRHPLRDSRPFDS
jgi:hypothetical protein